MASPAAGPVAPASPEMKQARSRLGTLLTGMQRSDENSTDPAEALCDSSLAAVVSSPLRTAVESGSAPGTPSRRRHGKRVVFELRLKPFELSDGGREQSLYALARLWVRGREQTVPSASVSRPDTSVSTDCSSRDDDRSLDLLATKEISSLPGKDVVQCAVQYVDDREPKLELEQATHMQGPEILSQYMDHWKMVKRHATYRSSVSARPYARSTNLLHIVRNIAESNRPS